jgi:hypothetical protein
MSFEPHSPIGPDPGNAPLPGQEEAALSVADQGLAQTVAPGMGAGMLGAGMGQDPNDPLGGMSPLGPLPPGMDPQAALESAAVVTAADVATREARGLLPEQPARAVDYTVPPPEDGWDALGITLVKEIERYLAATEERRENCTEYRRCAEMLPSEQEGPWAGAADMRAPFTAVTVDQHATRLNTQVLGADPPFDVLARKREAQAQAPLVREGLTAILDESGWRNPAREIHTELPIVGNCGLRIEWVTETIRRPVVKVDHHEDQYLDLTEQGVDDDVAWNAAVQVDDEGKARVFIDFEEVPVKDGIEVSVVPFEDLIILPVGCRDPRRAWGWGERVMIRGGTLREGALQGKYDEDAVLWLLEQEGDLDHEEQEERADEMGVDPVDGSGEFDANPFAAARKRGAGPATVEDGKSDYREYLCADLDLKGDLNRDGREEWYRITVHLRTHKVLRVQYLPWQHGQSSYVLFRYYTRTRQLWAAGVGERLTVVQDAATAALNTFFDMADLLAGQAGNFFYDDRAGLDVTRYAYKPGTPVRLNGSVDGILPMTFPQGLERAMQAMLLGIDKLKEYSELLTGVSNPSMGRETTGDKTLGELQIVVGQGMLGFEDKASGVAETWGEVFDRCRWLAAQFAKGGIIHYRKTAAPGDQLVDGQAPVVPGMPAPQVPYTFEQLPAEALEGDYDLIPAGLSAFADQAARVQRSMFLFQAMATNPLLGQNLEAQVEIIKQLLEDLKWPNKDTLLQKIKNGVAQMQAAAQMQMQRQTQMEDEAAGREGELHDQEMQDREQSRALSEVQGVVGVANDVQGLLTPGAKTAANPEGGKGKKPPGGKR